MAGSCGACGALSAHTLLFDLPPALLGQLCAVLDSCDGALGWRGLGECGAERGGAAGSPAARPGAFHPHRPISGTGFPRPSRSLAFLPVQRNLGSLCGIIK
ncbi:Hypothetical predicted protein [Marmota monax]|uniref:Secreted protein n=1 Tax=Marmota monax TaxID=9995 RepID=A0A5E4B8Z1_MARMO|nr:hypothetical protein GHT09_005539 [Marmota monax]VTJ65309.1 Hypothetical predicted protein [Marmota monax]